MPNAEIAWQAYDTGQAYDKLDMASWFYVDDIDDYAPVKITLEDLTAENAPCGTTACLAGWGLLLAGYTLREDGYNTIAAKDGVERVVLYAAERLFEINHDQARRLFLETEISYLEETLIDIFGSRPASLATPETDGPIE